jgi:hypothetical protein
MFLEPAQGGEFCALQNVTYDHRVFDPGDWKAIMGYFSICCMHQPRAASRAADLPAQLGLSHAPHDSTTPAADVMSLAT